MKPTKYIKIQRSTFLMECPVSDENEYNMKAGKIKQTKRELEKFGTSSLLFVFSFSNDL